MSPPSEAQRSPRTLLVGPLGERPWISRNDLVAQLEDLGHEVIVNDDDPSAIVPPPEPLPARVGALRNSLPSVLVWAARMVWRWRAVTNQRLRDARIDQVLVWDPILAAMCRVARPRGVEVIWVAARPSGTRFYERILPAALSATADRVVVSSEGAAWFGANTTVTRWPLPHSSTPPLTNEWVVIASGRPPSATILAALRARAVDGPARAVVFDVRDQHRAAPEVVERLRDAAGAKAVWWTGGDEWVQWAGGVPHYAVDASDSLSIDYRHLRVLGAGGALYVPDAIADGVWDELLEPVKTHDGWLQLAVRDDVGFPADERAWASSVFAALPSKSGPGLRASRPVVGVCPLCGDAKRRALGRLVAPPETFQCLECGLGYAGLVASGVAPPHVSGRRAAMRRRLRALDELDTEPRTLLDVSGCGAELARGARERGWFAQTAGIDTFDESDGLRFGVVVLGASLSMAEDPVRRLAFIREHRLADNGCVVIDTPNLRSWTRFVQGRRWVHWGRGSSHTYLDAWSVRQLLQRAGFNPQTVGTESGVATTRLGGSGLVVRTVAWLDARGMGQNLVAVGCVA